MLNQHYMKSHSIHASAWQLVQGTNLSYAEIARMKASFDGFFDVSIHEH
jgi:hypothetical protein